MFFGNFYFIIFIVVIYLDLRFSQLYYICHDYSIFGTFLSLIHKTLITGLGGIMSAEKESEVYFMYKILDKKYQVLILK